MVYIVHVHLCERTGQLQSKKSFQILESAISFGDATCFEG